MFSDQIFQLELLTHYGREHYCTLSLVRLLGISMVDEYEAEAEAAAAISGTPFSFGDVRIFFSVFCYCFY